MRQAPKILFLLLLFFYQAANGQAPQQFNYQAVARSAAGTPLVNQSVKLRLTIRTGSINGTSEYSETRAVTTNAFGLFSIAIGSSGASDVTGSVDAINWAGGTKFLQVELDPTGGSSFTDMGAQQLLSVPYALNSGDNQWEKTGAGIVNKNTGNVGIGVANPAYPVDVHGNINTDSSYKIGGNTVLRVKSSNLLLGRLAGQSLDPGEAFSNTIVGIHAGVSGVYASKNSFFGNQAGNQTTNGKDNSFLGHLAGYNNTTGDLNTFVGSLAGYGNTTNYANTFVGVFSGNASLGTGNYNTGIGYLTAAGNFIGNDNTFIGYGANPANNLFFLIHNSTAIGAGTMVGGSNQVRIGNTNVTSIGGFVGWSNLSDGRFKKELRENVPGLAFIKKLRPVTYHFDFRKLDEFHQLNDSIRSDANYKAGREAREKIVQTGLVAQEVERAARELGFDFSGVDAPQNTSDTYGLRYAEFTVPLIKAVQELAAENELLKKEITELKKMIQRIIK